MNRSTILKIAKEATAELGYRGWNVSSVWQQKSLALPAAGSENQETKTWFIDYTNDEGTLPRVYFKYREGAGELWVKAEIQRQLRSLRERLISTDAAPSESLATAPLTEVVETAPVPPSSVIAENFAPVKPVNGAPAANGKEAALLRAASDGDPEIVSSLLTAGAQIDTRLENGMTPLIRAAFFGHREVVQTLMARGADLEARDRLGMTALDWALSRDHHEVVQVLDRTAGQPPAVIGPPVIEETTPETVEPARSLPRQAFNELDLARPIASPSPAGTTAEKEETGESQPAVATAVPVPLVQAAAVGRRRVSSYLLASIIGGLAGLLVFFASLYWQRANRVSPAAVAPTPVDTAAAPRASEPTGPPAVAVESLPPPVAGDRSAREAGASGKKEREKPAAGKEKSQTPAESRKERGEASASRNGEREKSSRAALSSALDEWVAANNSRDLNRQMDFYAPKVGAFYRSRNVSREDVRAEKERLFGQANEVRVDAAQPEITVDKSGQTAVMRFRKRYVIKGQDTAANRRGEVIQELRWQKKDGTWRITSERDLKVIQ